MWRSCNFFNFWKIKRLTILIEASILFTEFLDVRCECTSYKLADNLLCDVPADILFIIAFSSYFCFLYFFKNSNAAFAFVARLRVLANLSFLSSRNDNSRRVIRRNVIEHYWSINNFIWIRNNSPKEWIIGFWSCNRAKHYLLSLVHLLRFKDIEIILRTLLLCHGFYKK